MITGSDLKSKIRLRCLIASEGGQVLSHDRGVEIYAMAERTKGRVVYAQHALAADRGVIFTIRERPAWRSQLIEWRGATYIPAEIWSEARGWLAIKAARVRVQEWSYAGDRSDPECLRWPGVLTERYQDRQEPDYHSELRSGWVLVTPKAVVLRLGDLIETGGKIFRVDVVHTMEEDVAEYELYSREDI